MLTRILCMNGSSGRDSPGRILQAVPANRVHSDGFPRDWYASRELNLRVRARVRARVGARV